MGKGTPEDPIVEISREDLDAFGLKDEKAFLDAIREADRYADELDAMTPHERRAKRKIMEDRFLQPGKLDEEAAKWLVHAAPFVDWRSMRARILDGQEERERRRKNQQDLKEMQALTSSFWFKHGGIILAIFWASMTALAVLWVVWRHRS